MKKTTKKAIKIIVTVILGIHIILFGLLYFFQEKLFFYPQKLEKNYVFKFNLFDFNSSKLCFDIFMYFCYVSKYIHKSHNVSVLLSHFVCPAKYRRVIFTALIDISLKDICLLISQRYQISFIEIGTDQDHVHFLIQSVPMYSPSKIIQIVKSLTAKELFRLHPEIKRQLWGGELWTKGFYVNTVGRHGDESIIQAYVKSQGREKEYKMLHCQQLSLSLS